MTAPTLSNVTRPRAFGYGCAIGERLFRLAVAPGREADLVTAPLEAPRVNTSSSPEEASSEYGLTYARSQFDGGEGLFEAHVPDAESDRYWDSKGVSVRVPESGEFPQITLLHDAAEQDANTTTSQRVSYDAVNGSLYVTKGAVLRRTDDPTVTTPTFADDDPQAAEGAVTVYDVAALGGDVYAALGSNGIHKKSSGTWTHWSDTPATRVWAVKGRIIAANTVSLYEVLSSGVPTTPTATVVLATGETWADVCDGGSVVLAGSSDGYVYSFGTDTGVLVLEAQTLFEGEQVCTVGQTQGVVAVGTCAGDVGRWYVGGVADDGQLSDLRLIRQWGTQESATTQLPFTTAATRSAIVTGITDGTDTYLWRYDVISGGVSRFLGFDGLSGEVHGIVSIDGWWWFCIDEEGPQREESSYVSDGWLMAPLGDFFSAQAKSWVSASVDTGEINGTAVEVWHTVNADDLADETSAGWTRDIRRASGTGDQGEEALTPVVSRRLAGMVRLYASDDLTSTPEVRSFSFRGFVSSDERIVTLPVNVSDQIERRGRRSIRVPGRGDSEYAALRSLEGQPATVQLFSPAVTVVGLVEQVSTRLLAQPHRGSPTMIAEVRVRGRIVGSASTVTGTGFYGDDQMYATGLPFGVAS